MKFLICGLGSIGQRHVRIIRRVLGDDADIAAYRSRRLDLVISDRLEATFDIKPEEHYGLQTFHDFAEALSWKPDAVFVTNPISLHLPTALAAARAGCHLFIEKPLSHDTEHIAELAQVAKEKQLVCMVGYQLRYHPAYLKIRQLLESNAIGRLTSADLHFGEWLPGMHPYEDYRESHAARKDQGGGVILCLSHEIDIASWLFGKPLTVYAVGGHLSDLEMDVEDTVDMILSCTSGGREFPVHVHLDFLEKPARRYAHIAGEKGSILFDYPTSQCEIRRLPGGDTETFAFGGFQRNDMFFHEVSDFIESINRQCQPPIPLEDGITTLSICLAAKRSLASGRVEKPW
jgi:predicted dehydrogenase